MEYPLFFVAFMKSNTLKPIYGNRQSTFFDAFMRSNPVLHQRNRIVHIMDPEKFDIPVLFELSLKCLYESQIF